MEKFTEGEWREILSGVFKASLRVCSSNLPLEQKEAKSENSKRPRKNKIDNPKNEESDENVFGQFKDAFGGF